MAKFQFHSTSTAGIRYKEHPTRKHGKKPDKYFVIRYRRDGKTIQEGMGWASQEKITQEKAAKALADIKENIRNGTRPQSLAEKRQMEQERRDAEAQEKERLAAESKAQEKNNLTFEEVWKKYFELAESTKTARTATTEKISIEKWALPAIGKKRLADIVTLDLERIKKKMLDAGRAARTVEYHLAMIRQVFNYAKDNGLFSGKNPAQKVKKLKYDNKRERFLTQAEAESLLNTLKARNMDLHDLALLSLHTGGRFGELAALEWIDLDFNDGRITFRETKNSESRSVYMSEAVKAMLTRRREAPANKSALVFPAQDGGRIKNISLTFNRIIEDETKLNQGITDRRHRFTFHTLRHSAASWLAQKGTPMIFIQRLLGHKTAALTERYVKLAPGNLRDVTAIFDQAAGTGKQEGADVIPLTGTTT